MILGRLRAKLDPWSLFSDSVFDRDLDAYLDWRETDSTFESQWLRVYGEVKARDKHDADDEIKEIEKTIFLRVSKLTSQHEIASYVGDDFDLICRALITGCNDPWLNGLYLSYKRNQLPDSSLESLPGSLADLI